MEIFAESLERLREEFARLPGIGRKTAERLAFHVLMASRDEAMGLALAIRDVKARIRHCSVCFNLTEDDPCRICSDTRRRRDRICVVERPRDLIALERAAGFDGLYHVLGGRVSPLEGIGPESLTLEQLVGRVRNGEVREVILATNPDVEGDATSLLVAEALAGHPVSVTRIARGIPSGASIEYVSDAILREALAGRHGMDARDPP
jgi:recombination protein RecR